MAATGRPAPQPVWTWLAPATCLFLMLIGFGMVRHGNAGLLTISGNSNLVADLSPSNLAFLALSRPSDTHHEERNVWTGATFDWTKSPAYLTTTGSFPSWKTNF